MKAPRHAHWLVVPALTVGMAVGPVAHAQAPAGKPAPSESDSSAVEGAEPAPEDAPKGEAVAEPTDDAGAEPTDDAGAEPKDEGDAAPTDAADAAPTDEGDATTEPSVTVKPQPVGSAAETGAAPLTDSSREVVADPRRLRSDERLLFRAGILSLGVATAAIVPTVIGFQQAYVADQEGLTRRARSMNQLGIGAGIVAGTYAITGAVLLALGSRRLTERRTAVAPALGPGQVGAVLRTRF